MAQSASYAKSDTRDTLEIEFQWADHYAQPQTLAFSLDKTLLNQPFSKSKAYSQHLARQHIFIEMMKLAQGVDPKEASITVRKLGTELDYRVRGNNQKLVNQWRQKLKQAQNQTFDDYLNQNYYVKFRSAKGQSGVKPDHVRFAQESTDPLRNVAQAVYDIVPEGSLDRVYVDVVLSWIQSIPYDTLENRLTSNGAGYIPPIALLASNHGDCDSKTVLTAAILHSLFPKATFHFVFLDNHALLAANFAHTADEARVLVGQEHFLLMEPTGPAALPAGQIAPSSLQAIASGNYVIETLR